MLRMALIASLVLINLSVWTGPAEVLSARGKAMLDSRPDYERAQDYVMKGDIAEAASEYRGLIAATPDNASYHMEYGLLCYNNGPAIQAALGWTRDTLLSTVVEEFRRARDLTPGDFSMSSQYALALMDKEFFGTALPRDTVLEAWHNTLSIVLKKGEAQPDGSEFDLAAAHVYLQLARAEYRFGRTEEMQQYLDQALKENPGLRIPSDLQPS